MITVPIEALPNQLFSITLDEVMYDITIKEADGLMAITIVRDNITIVEGERILPGALLMPYGYQYQNMGNFLFITADDEYPYYDQFGITQFLMYASNAELEAIIALGA